MLVFMRCSFLKGAQLMFCDELFYDRSFVTDATTNEVVGRGCLSEGRIRSTVDINHVVSYV